MKTDTPRTDAQATGNSDPQEDEYEDLLYFTRTLERELTAVTEQRDGLKQAVDCTNDLLASVTEQRDRLAVACKKLMAIIGEPNSLIDDCWVSEDEMDEAWNIADEALQSLTTNAETIYGEKRSTP